jgi:hypothetical protein
MALDQIPAAPQTANETITTPIVNSPLKDRFSDRSSQLSGERERRKTDGVRLFEANSASKRRKLNRAIPSTSLLSFLRDRDNAINQRIEEYDGKIGSIDVICFLLFSSNTFPKRIISKCKVRHCWGCPSKSEDCRF